MGQLDLKKRVKAYMETNGILEKGDRVLVALSGGADSVCLLYVLAQAVQEPGGIRALHVHHGLRGEEADRDERFAESLCRQWKVPLAVEYRDVKRYAKENGMSEEEAGRMLRYEALENAACAWEQEAAGPSPVKIAVAHHLDDNAETIFHHLLRGSGLRGLSGMKPVQGRRIRPLLCVRREEILQYLRAEGVDWREDSTNRSEGYTRNRIRNRIFPMLEEQVNAHAVENILHAGRLFAQADAYLERQAQKILCVAGRLDAGPWPERKPGPGNGVGDGRDKGTVPALAQVRLEDFLEQEQVIRPYILRMMLDAAAPGQKNITSRHFEQLERLAGLPVGSRCDLPGGLYAGRDYKYLWIGQKPCTRRQAYAEGARVQCVEGAQGQGSQGGILEFCTFSYEKGTEIPKNQYTKWFDYDKIKGTLSVRTRQGGDYLVLSGGGHKSLNRYMIDEKIPRQERDDILLLAEGHHILWVVGYRISEYYKITEETQTILQAVVDGGKRDGRQNSGVIVGRGSGPQDQ